MAKTRFRAEAHIPRGSGDAEYRIVANLHDGSPWLVLAIIDPNMALDDPAHVADVVADLLNENPDAIL